MINIALVGNQNVGKTTIFNYLTGLNHHIGNFPGTTVTISKGTYLKNNQITIIDLPGIYSLTPFTQEEKIARDYLTSENIDYIINIIDATALFRCLFLTIQCLKLKIPMILAINKIELLKKHQGILNLEKLSSNLNVPCYPINALNGQGIDLCLQLLFTQQFNHSLKIDDIQQVLKDCYQSPIFHLSRFDHILLSKYLSYPLLFFFFLLVFILSFGIVGPFFNHLFSSFFEQAISIFSLLFVNHLHPILFSLIVNGIFRGCLSLLSFLPLILILFFFISLLEDSGYIARVSVLMDAFLRKIGLSGKSFVPLFLGLGCTVPAILATRILKSKQERKIVIFLLPFLSCSAKLPIYLLFIQTFFSSHHLLFLFSLYFGGIFLGLTLISFPLHNINNTFILEIPPYHFPSIKNTFQLLKEKTKEFTSKVFTIILLLNILLWFLQYFTIQLHYTTNQTQSLLYVISKSISWIFIPLGFNDWRITTALISGFTAKEAILSTFALLFQSSNAVLSTQLTHIFTPISAFSFLLFTLLYTPCISAIAITYKEMGLKNTIFMIAFQCSIAWLVAFIFYSISMLFI